MTRSYDEIVSALLAIPKFGNGIGLHRVLWLCHDLMAAPWMRNLDAIKVTGSNGKGSVCAMTSSILRELGLDVGLYISPHLVRFNERISINGDPITDQELDEALDWFVERKEKYSRSNPLDTIGAFEAFTAMALHHYAKHQPHTLVVEAGIGGRYDSTRIVPGRLVGLASLDLEHTQMLGDTLELIAYDKTDLCTEHGKLVIGSIDTDVLRRLKAYCELRQITPLSVDEMCMLFKTEFGENGMVVDIQIGEFHFQDLRIGLQGHHQVTNAEVAVLLAQEWVQERYPELGRDKFIAAVHKGLASARNTGRFQRIGRNPDIFIDVGHSPAAIDCLVETVKSVIQDRPILLVTGVSYDKEVEKIISGLLAVANAVICTRAYHKGSPVEAISSIVRKRRPDLLAFEADTIEKAVTLARELASKENMTVLIAGGLFLSIEAMQALAGKDPKALRFF